MVYLLQFLLGWYLADLISGIYHYIMDNYGSPSTPLFGRQIAEFRLHHENPDVSISRYDLKTFATLFLLAIPLFCCSYFLWTYFFISLSLGVLFCQFIHKFAHMKNPIWIIKIMQKIRFFIPSYVHNQHHTDFKHCYCIVNGWANPLLDSLLKFFLRTI